MKSIQEEVSDVETQQPINRRSLLLAAFGGATAMGTLGLSEPTLANHSGIPHITDVTDFGAMGDGTTDDTDAIQAAIDSIPRGTVFFPPGEYLTDKTLVIEDKPIILAGAGMHASAIHYKGMDDAIIFRRASGVDLQGSGVRDLKIEGMGGASPGAGLHLDRSLFMAVERVWIRRFGGPGGVGLRMTNTTQDIYLAHVHLQACDVGLVVDGAFQTTAVNLMVNQNRTGGARFTAASVFRWIGGLVQGQDPQNPVPQEFGVLFEPSAAGLINNVTLDGLWFEGAFQTFVKATPPPKGRGITTLKIENNRLSNSVRPESRAFFDLTGVVGLTVLNNRLFFSPNDTLLRLRKVQGAVVGLNNINFQFEQNPDMIDIEGVDVVWLGSSAIDPELGGSGIGIGTPLPPIEEKLAVGGRSHFATVGSGLILAGQDRTSVDDDRLGPESHIMVTLNDDPGRSRGIRYVKNRHADSTPGFTVVLNKSAKRDTPLTYFIVN